MVIRSASKRAWQCNPDPSSSGLPKCSFLRPTAHERSLPCSQDLEFSARATPLKRMRGVPFVPIMEKMTAMLRGPRALAIAARFAFVGARMMSQECSQARRVPRVGRWQAEQYQGARGRMLGDVLCLSIHVDINEAAKPS